MFAPKGEKALYNAIRDHAAPQVIAQIGEEHAPYRTLAFALAGLLMLDGGELPEVIRLLSAAFAAGDDPANHPFTQKYLATHVEIHIATGITVAAPGQP